MPSYLCPRRRRSLALCLAAVTSLLASAAQADPNEYLHGIALHPRDPNQFFVRYESALGGLLLSRDGGHSVQLVPGQTFYRYALNRSARLGYGGDGKLLLGLESGLDVDDGMGCFPPAPEDEAHDSDPVLKGLWVADVVAHPTDPDTTFLVTRAETMGGRAGLWRRDKQGTVSALGASDPLPVMRDAMPDKVVPFVVTDLSVIARAASMEGLRFIEAGVQRDPDATSSTSKFVLRVSDDLAATWTSHDLPADTGTSGGLPRILLVDASEPFKVIVAIENGPGDDATDPIDPLFVSRDGAQSFAPYLAKVQVLGDALLLPSGRILIADRGTPQSVGALWSAADFAATPGRLGEQSVNCLAYQPATQKVFMCRPYEVGYYDVAANTFCAIFQLNEAVSFPTCVGTSLMQNQKGIMQLCNGFCGAKHFPSAPLCSTFPVAPGKICGPSAVAYDNADPDPEKRSIESPGGFAAPRCAGFSERPDAGGVAAPDAGMSAADAGAAPGLAPEAGSAQREDAAADDVGAEDMPGLTEDAGTVRDKPEGCGCRLTTTHARVERTQPWALLGLAALLGVRRRRRA